LPTGNYSLTAYTRSMRNEGESVFFNKTIGIFNTFKTDAAIGIDTVPPDVSAFSFSGSENNLSVATGKQMYKTRSQGEIHLQGLPENIHSLSISVAGEDFIANTGNIIKWNNQLPDYAKIQLKNDFLPEYEGHIICGRIVNSLTNQPPEGHLVSSILGFTGDQLRVFGGVVDSEYNVQFITTRITGTKGMAIANYTSSDDEYRVNIQSPFETHSDKTLPALRLNTAWKDRLLQRSVGLQVLYAYVADSMSRVDSTYAHFQWKADRSYILDEYTRFTTMEEIAIEFIHAIRFRRFENKYFLSVFIDENNTFSSGNTLVTLDGIPITDYGIIFKYSPLLVYKIDIYKEKYVFGDKRYEGVVAFTTYKNDYPGLVLGGSTHLFDYEGTQLHRYFYSPSYQEKSDIDSKIPDYRHTLLWAPEVETGGQSALSVPFSTSDLTGEFQVTVEGLCKDGKVFRGTSLFKVENP